MKDQKIIILGPAHPLRGGIADFNESLAKELQIQGYKVVIYSFKFQYPKFLFPGKTQQKEGPAPDYLQVKEEVHSLNPFNWRSVANKIAVENPQLVITRFWLPVMGMSLGSISGRLKKAGIPVVAIVDNVVPHEKRPGDKRFTKFFIKRCDGFIAMSKAVIDDLRGYTASEHVRLLPHPVYNVFGPSTDSGTALRTLKLDINKKRLLFFGLVREYKGLDVLLQAMPEIIQSEPNIELIVAGEFYDDETKYRTMVEDLNIGAHVSFHNRFIPDEEVKHFFAAADCVVQPYKTATQSGITQIAYNFDTPMIVSNVGGLPEIVDHGISGLVVEPQPTAIANAVKEFYKNGGRPHYEPGVVEGKKRFSWSYFLNGLWELVGALSSK